MAILFQSDEAISRVKQAISKAIDRLDQLDPNDREYFIKADLENALSELRDGQYIKT